MTTRATDESIEGRVVLIDPESRTVFAVPARSGYRLVRTSIPSWARPARQLQRADRETWGIKITILDLLAGEEHGYTSCVLAEVVAPRHLGVRPRRAASTHGRGIVVLRVWRS